MEEIVTEYWSRKFGHGLLPNLVDNLHIFLENQKAKKSTEFIDMDHEYGLECMVIWLPYKI